jgi:DNA-binding NarL/FixJ family response regulator
VLLVDDHIVVRAGYRVLLRDVPEIEVIGEAESGEAAYRQYVEKAPDVVVMDLSLPGMGGLEAIRRITARDADARILVFSMHDDVAFVDQALRAVPAATSPNAARRRCSPTRSRRWPTAACTSNRSSSAL